MIRSILDVRDKRLLTQTLVDLLDPQLGITFETAYATWWHNLRKNGGMRLTKDGYLIFSNLLTIDHYNFNVEPFDVNSKLIIAMDRQLQHPYYIVTKKMMPVQIVFFSSKEAMMANLYGDIKKFIDNYWP